MSWLEAATRDYYRLPPAERRNGVVMAVDFCHSAWMRTGHYDRAAELRRSAAPDMWKRMRSHQGAILLTRGCFEKGWRILQDFEDGWQGSSIMRAFADLSKQGRLERAAELVNWLDDQPGHVNLRPDDEKARRWIRPVADDNARRTHVALLLAKAGQADQAEKLAGPVTAPVDRLLLDYVIRVVRMTETPTADWPKPPAYPESAKHFRNPDQYTPDRFATTYARMGYPKLAARAAETAADTKRRAAHYASLARIYAQSGEPKHAQDAIDRCRSLLNSLADERYVSLAHAGLAEAAAMSDKPELARHLLQKVKLEGRYKVEVWARLGDVEKLMEVSAAEPDSPIYDIDVTEAMIEAGRLDELEEIIESRNLRSRIHMYTQAVAHRVAKILRQRDTARSMPR